MTITESLFDQSDVIASYSRADALRDGALISLDSLAREYGFQWPVAITAAAHADLIAWSEDEYAIQDEDARAWDVLTIVKFMALPAVLRLIQQRGEPGQSVLSHVVRVPRGSRSGKPRKGHFKLHAGPGDDMQPVLTIMLPSED